MSVESHLEALERRHEALSKEIDDVLKSHPSVDALQLAMMKRRKLQLKDEIVRIKTDNSVH